jgi:hypothetical protein
MHGIALGIGCHSSSILLALLPFTFVTSTIGPHESPQTMLRIANIFANILRAVRPDHPAMSRDMAFLPLTSESAAIFKFARADTLHLLIDKLAIINHAVSDGENTNTMAARMRELTFVPSAIRPSLDTSAALLAI